ncbi:VOC family protein [Paracoccus tegillarcae]|uniref:VOC family protein n=1 Tax=Paracoccus tegillarcae TaxID=1529068 RepID=A0A2K9EG41_9RHOB|nr:VOC family protein [Paracoccus tegillarcae]AUH32287.1 VOC family protein [Paracoccus tegillarcae]
MQFTPYLSFQGQCYEAFTTYAEIFGGATQLMRFSDMPAGTEMPEMPPEQTGWIMHGQVDLPDGGVLMGADMPPQFGGQKMAGASVAISLKDEAEVKRIFDALSPDAQISMAVGPTFFSSAFGMLTDRFGTSWMIMGAPAQ